MFQIILVTLALSAPKSLYDDSSSLVVDSSVNIPEYYYAKILDTFEQTVDLLGYKDCKLPDLKIKILTNKDLKKQSVENKVQPFIRDNIIYINRKYLINNISLAHEVGHHVLTSCTNIQDRWDQEIFLATEFEPKYTYKHGAKKWIKR